MDLDPPAAHQNQAGFVPPQVSTFSQLDQHKWQGGAVTVTAGRHGEAGTSVMDAAARVVPQGHRKGGRRPKDDGASPEEELRRRMRRERNKQAAARCRRRRLDLTNTLQAETERLEDIRSQLEREVRELQAEKEELDYLMAAHQPACRFGGGKENVSAPRRAVTVKQEPVEQAPRPVAAAASARPTSLSVARPTSLSVTPLVSGSGPGVAMGTPSQGLGLNFDSLLEGGTGLTPITSAGLTPLLMPQVSTSGLATPVTTAGYEQRRSDMLSPGERQLVSL